MTPALPTTTELLDSALGPVDSQTRDAIMAICNDALADMLGSAVVGLLRSDHSLLPRVAPWIWDLARGLQYQSKHGATQPSTADLLISLRGRPLPPEQAHKFAETIDLAVMLTLDRITEQILGPGARSRDPARNEATAPWLAGLTLGYRIHLAQELLRLSATG